MLLQLSQGINQSDSYLNFKKSSLGFKKSDFYKKVKPYEPTLKLRGDLPVVFLKLRLK